MYNKRAGDFMIVPDYIERSKRKTLSLTVLKDGNIIVKAPISMKDEVINRFVEEKQGWIRSKLAIFKENKTKFEDVIGFRQFLLYGNRYTILKSQVKTIETNDKFQILVPSKCEDSKVLKVVVAWYKKIAKQVLSDRFAFIENRIRLKASTLKFSDSKGRWGSCNSFGTVHLNWRVIMLPPDIIDYVIVHELCHLKELNHSKEFWMLVKKFLPEYEKQKKAIKEYGFLLGMYEKRPQ